MLQFPKATKLEYQKEIKDKEGRYIIVKGTIVQAMVTLVNIYAPSESNSDSLNPYLI